MSQGHAVSPFAWMRVNLFSTPVNGALTLLILALLAWLVPKAGGWLIWDAVWGPKPASACDAIRGEGACWAVVWDKIRFMLFGVYPFEEQWRAAIAAALLTSLLVISAIRSFWRKRLIAIWAVGIVLSFWLMGGGFGLTPVPAERWGGLSVTLILAIFGIGFAFPLGVLLALGRRSRLPVIRAVSVLYIEIVRGVPLITVLFMASIMFALLCPRACALNNCCARRWPSSCSSPPIWPRPCAGACRRFRAGNTKPPRRWGFPTGARWG